MTEIDKLKIDKLKLEKFNLQRKVFCLENKIEGLKWSRGLSFAITTILLISLILVLGENY